jgi:hypothetical protein
MDNKKVVCPDCDAAEVSLDRRDFLRTVGASAAAAATAGLPLFATPRATAAPSRTSAAETAVKALYDSLTDDQRKEVCFDWDYVETKPRRKNQPPRGLLRTHVSNNWEITDHFIRSDFYTKQQQHIIHDIFRGLINPEWYAKFLKQLKDDTDGMEWGERQSIAIFGIPGSDKFEFVMTGRHMTLRADGNSEAHVAFGGPIFYGHAASGFNEKPGHPGNVFWEQARKANFVYQLLDPKQQERALVTSQLPQESKVPLQGPKGTFPGIAVAELANEQKQELQKVLQCLIEPYRSEDRDEVIECLKKQGGLDRCHLAFYKKGDIGNDGEWDNWRLEGPSFVWYFRGQPHVHVWVNVADDSSPKLNSRG